MKYSDYKKGKYAELMTEYAEHIYRDRIEKTERNSIFIAPEGTEREVDVSTTLTTGEKIAFEVRDRKSTQGIDWIDQIIGKYIDSPYDYVWLCTFDGCKLSSEAVKKLEHYKIGWRDFYLVAPEGVDLKDPVLIVRGIVVDEENLVLTVNGKPYRDLQIAFVKDAPPESIIQRALNELLVVIRHEFGLFDGIGNAVFNEHYDLQGVENNFEEDSIEVKIEVPLIHKVFMDFFDEKYIVRNEGEESVLLSTSEKAVFCTEDTIVVNLSYFGRQFSHRVVLEPNWFLSTKMLPDEMRKRLKNFRFIDAEGTANGIVPMRIYGLRR